MTDQNGTQALALKVNDLHVHYGSICALAAVDLELTTGHCVGVLGPNGAGKSTLLKCIAGLLPVITGSISWRAQPLAEVRREIAYLPQMTETDLRFPVTVRGLVEMGRYPHLGSFGRWTRQDTQVVDEVMETLGLRDLSNRRLNQLSGGQRQRLQVARALAQEARVLLLDEPFAGLDEPSQENLGELLHQLSSRGHLLMVCHHDLKMVPKLFDQVVLLNRRLIQAGPVAESFTPEFLRSAFREPAPNLHA
jgi:ABC-type Mn2+/Zn2+ transport system ATPase subunit